MREDGQNDTHESDWSKNYESLLPRCYLIANFIAPWM